MKKNQWKNDAIRESLFARYGHMWKFINPKCFCPESFQRFVVKLLVFISSLNLRDSIELCQCLNS